MKNFIMKITAASFALLTTLGSVGGGVSAAPNSEESEKGRNSLSSKAKAFVNDHPALCVGASAGIAALIYGMCKGGINYLRHEEQANSDEEIKVYICKLIVKALVGAMDNHKFGRGETLWQTIGGEGDEETKRDAMSRFINEVNGTIENNGGNCQLECGAVDTDILKNRRNIDAINRITREDEQISRYVRLVVPNVLDLMLCSDVFVNLRPLRTTL